MPLTIITLKKSPPSLRGDLTKWMQEIATGVYVGNFNTKVREQLWERVKQSVGTGEATMSYAYRNEIGYRFETLNTQRQVVDFDGIPLVLLENYSSLDESPALKMGYSNASKYRQAKKYATKRTSIRSKQTSYVVIDIETDGTDPNHNKIIEIGAIKVENENLEEFNYLIAYDKQLPTEITELTGITQSLLSEKGHPLAEVLKEFVSFIGNCPLVGYGVHFDIRFLNQHLHELQFGYLKNKIFDLLSFVKKEKMFLNNYKLETALYGYGIQEKVPHRALLDARLIYQLSTKVNKFLQLVNQTSPN